MNRNSSDAKPKPGNRGPRKPSSRSAGKPGKPSGKRRDQGADPKRKRPDGRRTGKGRASSVHRSERKPAPGSGTSDAGRRRKRKTLSSDKAAYPWSGVTGDVEIITSTAVEQIVDDLGLELPPERRQKLLDHLLLVREINRDINLISRKSENEVLLVSLWESLLCLQNERWRSKVSTILDLGTGGGFPGICLAVAAPDLAVTLLDSRRAKTLALKRMVQELDLKNVTVLHDRAETLPAHLDDPSFDCVTARYVGMLKEIVPWSAPLLKPDGFLLIWKGAEGIKEWKVLETTTWKMIDHKNLSSHRGVLFLQYQPADA
ncbi:16S rRNA (guanine(527)-N(7))-methyltransferase RsmG [bacterium]|nr:16S rRNA (guanine(527)-N(7))-methyltransferase RsmG [bacterium]